MGQLCWSRAALYLHGLCGFFALGSFTWGYNVGILSSVLSNDGFEALLHQPNSCTKGLITAIYYLGTWLSYVFLSRAASDHLGRRYAALLGAAINCVGTALFVGANSYHAFAMIIAGRIISGIGIGMISTSVPLYQSEIAPAAQRGRFVVMNHVGMVAGLAAGFWVGYGITYWTSPWGLYVGWRVSVAVEFVPAVVLMAGLPFLPETPRWLVEHGKLDRAKAVLTNLREGLYGDNDNDAERIALEYDEICAAVAEHHATGAHWTLLFRDRSLFNRLWRASLLQFMAQMCGATAIKYYLSTLFNVLGLGTRMALLAGGIESTIKIGCTVLEMLVIDRLGRRVTMIAGASVMAFSMLINGVLPIVYPHNQNHTSDYTCIVFIFIYSLGYSLSFGPAAWVYGSEIFPTVLRATGLNFAASGGAIGSIVVAQAWPVGIDRIGSRIYFFFMAINFVCIPILYFFYPETKGVALEDMDALFGRITVFDESPEELGAEPELVNEREAMKLS